MTGTVLLTGPLAHPALMAALTVEGRAATLRGRLSGGAQAGLIRDGWPALLPGDGDLPAVRVQMTERLARYAEVMGLHPQHSDSQPMLGVMPGGTSDDWSPQGWPADLAAEIAREVLAAPRDRPAAEIAARLPMIAGWAASRLRGRARPLTGGDLVQDRGAGGWHLIRRDQPYADFFAVEEWHLTHRLHGGGNSPQVKRAAFLSGDAVVVLPWDKARDRVLLIEQFRPAPALRDDPQPWLLETIAGRVDAGETPADAARREAQEEARLTLDHLIPAVHHYPSPGALGEYLYMYVAPCDLPDGITGVHGVETEAEDIRSLLIPRAELTRLVLTGQIANGPLALLALWLETQAGRL
ncbi:MAG: NUDIX domain-containing protein [Paracoccus sp. (in: a-proteobacteria)]|uniref:NUDIX domain-containing protein n=1 Tax=Paracoccus sp. TaxID=267 RepID=UPI0026E01720|nr:NUDIX domain-containing protein [Paracoccus sp. (in: a-proteobacteria)]MDO5614493.1 NUDIX domain-containing protein [Paracoccus sp. (in: a-proteobacteria)]